MEDSRDAKVKRVTGCTGPIGREETSRRVNCSAAWTEWEVMRSPSLSVEKKSSQNMQRMGATTTWLMAARWIRWLSLVGTYA